MPQVNELSWLFNFFLLFSFLLVLILNFNYLSFSSYNKIYFCCNSVYFCFSF